MNKYLIAIWPVAAGLVACSAASSNAVQAQVAAEPTSSQAWISRVAALGTSGTQLTGTVRLTPSGKSDEYKVTIDMRGAKFENRIPWSVSTGDCGEASSHELGNRAAYRMIDASADGSAHFKTNVKLSLRGDARYHVDFFAGPTNPNQIVACGTLVAGA